MTGGLEGRRRGGILGEAARFECGRRARLWWLWGSAGAGVRAEVRGKVGFAGARGRLGGVGVHW